MWLNMVIYCIYTMCLLFGSDKEHSSSYSSSMLCVFAFEKNLCSLFQLNVPYILKSTHHFILKFPSQYFMIYRCIPDCGDQIKLPKHIIHKIHGRKTKLCLKTKYSNV